MVWDYIGGGIGFNYNKQPNTCAARLSCGLNDGGAPIKPLPKTDMNYKDRRYKEKPGDGNRYFIRARDMKEYLVKEWGKPDAIAKSANDLNKALKSLKSGECAIFASSGHVGVLMQGYQDPSVYGMVGRSHPFYIWVLKAKEERR